MPRNRITAGLAFIAVPALALLYVLICIFMEATNG